MASSPPPLPPPSKRVRDQVREHLIPANTVLGFSLALVSMADLLVPRLLPLASGLRNVALVVSLGLVVAAFWPRPIDWLLVQLGVVARPQAEGGSPGRRYLWARRLIVPALLVAVALSATLSQADTGGVVASQFPSVRTLQQQLLGLRSEVMAIGDGVAQANRTLEAINAREQAVQQQMAESPVSVGLLDLQGTGLPAQRGGAWPMRLAVHLHAAGEDFSQVQLRLAHGATPDQRRVESLGPALGGGTAPGAVQLMLNLPADTRWVSACLVLGRAADPQRQALLHRWRVVPQADLLMVRPDGAAALRPAHDAACAAS